MWIVPIIIFVVAAIVIGTVDEKWRAERGMKPRVPKNHDRYVDEDDDRKYVTRAQGKRQAKQQKRTARFKDDPFEDYSTYTDNDGNEHSLDYDDFCDDCDEYHDE